MGWHLVLFSTKFRELNFPFQPIKKIYCRSKKQKTYRYAYCKSNYTYHIFSLFIVKYKFCKPVARGLVGVVVNHTPSHFSGNDRREVKNVSYVINKFIRIFTEPKRVKTVGI